MSCFSVLLHYNIYTVSFVHHLMCLFLLWPLFCSCNSHNMIYCNHHNVFLYSPWFSLGMSCFCNLMMFLSFCCMLWFLNILLILNIWQCCCFLVLTIFLCDVHVGCVIGDSGYMCSYETIWSGSISFAISSLVFSSTNNEQDLFVSVFNIPLS